MSKLSKNQRRIARVAFPMNKITGADFKKLRGKKKKKKASGGKKQFVKNTKTVRNA